MWNISSSGTLLTGDELHVVHKEHVGIAVFFPEFLIAPLPDGLDQLIGEGVALQVDDPVVRVVLVDAVGDGVEQVGLAQAGFAVDEQGIIAVGGIFSHSQSGGMGKFVGRAYHEALEGIVLGAGHEGAVVHRFCGLGELLQFSLPQDHHVKLGGKEFVQGLFDGGEIAGKDDITLEIGGGMEDKRLASKETALASSNQVLMVVAVISASMRESILAQTSAGEFMSNHPFTGIGPPGAAEGADPLIL